MVHVVHPSMESTIMNDNGHHETNVNERDNNMTPNAKDKFAHDMTGNKIVIAEGFNLSPVDYILPQDKGTKSKYTHDFHQFGGNFRLTFCITI